MLDTFTVSPGGAVISHQPIGFAAIAAVRVDNFSGAWLSIEGTQLWVPPYTRGYIANLFPTIASISTKSYDNAYGNVITTALGHSSTFVLYSANDSALATLQDSEGVSFIDEQVVVQFAMTVVSVGTLGSTLIAAPAAGHIRVYELSISWAEEIHAPGPTKFTNEGVQVSLGSVTWGQILDISPSNPRDSATITSPGNDLAAGQAMMFDVVALSSDGNYDNRVRVNAKYAVI